MIYFSKLLSAFFLTSLLTVSAIADSQPSIRGQFKIDPKVMHHESITGQLEVVFENDAIAQVKLKTDLPVMGRTDFQSSEQWLNKVKVGDKDQLAIAYKIAGTPHGWYFVVIGQSAEGITFDSTFYKAKAKFDDIQSALKNGVPALPDGKHSVPATWKAVGTATLKY